jgi:hypothetical protein
VIAVRHRQLIPSIGVRPADRTAVCGDVDPVDADGGQRPALAVIRELGVPSSWKPVTANGLWRRAAVGTGVVVDRRATPTDDVGTVVEGTPAHAVPIPRASTATTAALIDRRRHRLV